MSKDSVRSVQFRITKNQWKRFRTKADDKCFNERIQYAIDRFVLTMWQQIDKDNIPNQFLKAFWEKARACSPTWTDGPIVSVKIYEKTSEVLKSSDLRENHALLAMVDWWIEHDADPMILPQKKTRS